MTFPQTLLWDLPPWFLWQWLLACPSLLFLLTLTSKCWNPQTSALGPLLFFLRSCWAYPLSLGWTLPFVDDIQKHLYPNLLAFISTHLNTVLVLLTCPKPSLIFGSTSFISLSFNTLINIWSFLENISPASDLSPHPIYPHIHTLHPVLYTVFYFCNTSPVCSLFHSIRCPKWGSPYCQLHDTQLVSARFPVLARSVPLQHSSVSK